jgi:cyclin-dependent kinase
MDTRFERIARIGEGAYGVVYKARDRQHDTIVALKRVRLNSQDEGIPCTTIREISLLKELQHDNIVRLLDVVHSSEKLTIVFEYLDCDLHKYMELRNNNLPAATVQSFSDQLLAGIAYCHARSVLHRDLKPQNLLVLRDTYLKLADFGLGRAFSIPVKKVTHEVVTLWYRAPDVLLGSTTYGTPVDMWSVGCIMAEMVSGTVLFPGHNDVEQLRLIFEHLGKPTTENWPTIGQCPLAERVLSRDEFRRTFTRSIDSVFAQPLYMDKLGPLGVDLLKRILRYEPSQRLTADQAREHEYFRMRF